tara:strand:- start:2054 stop:3160 length:1107 start_codon:yes stop_codon:yes gene_type:complete
MPTDAVQDFISRLLARERVSARDPEGEEFTLGIDPRRRSWRALPGEIRPREGSSPPAGPRRGIERERISPYSGTRGDPVVPYSYPGEKMGWFWTKEGGWDMDPEVALAGSRETGTRTEEPERVHFPEGFLGSAKGVFVGGPPYPDMTYEDLLRARRERFAPPDYWAPSDSSVQAVDYPPEMPWLDPTLEPRGTWGPPRREYLGGEGTPDRMPTYYGEMEDREGNLDPEGMYQRYNPGRPPNLPPHEYWGPPMTPQFYGNYQGMDGAHYIQRTQMPGDVPFERPEREIFERRVREAIRRRDAPMREERAQERGRLANMPIDPELWEEAERGRPIQLGTLGEEASPIKLKPKDAKKVLKGFGFTLDMGDE